MRRADDGAPVSRASRASSTATAIAFAPSSRDVGSSASSSSGFAASARAIATRARSPCESRLTRCVARSPSPTDSSAASATCLAALVATAQRERELDVLERGQMGHEPRLLPDVCDPVAAHGGPGGAVERRQLDPVDRRPRPRPEARARRAGAAASSCPSPTGRPPRAAGRRGTRRPAVEHAVSP